MLSILVDEGYAYDYLSILLVKNDKKYYDIVSSNIEKEIGKDLHEKILNSKEFGDLYKANIKTFNAVEKARYSDISAKEVDDCNINRYKCKISLQNKFFPNNKILEIKTWRL